MGTGKTYSTRYLADSNNNTGAAGQVLSTTSTGIDWVDANTVPGAGLWLENGNDIYNSNSGNVGIGVTTTGAKLQIDKANANSSVIISRSGTNIGVSTGVGSIAFPSHYNSSYTDYAVIQAYSNNLSAVRGSLDLKVKSTSGNLLTGLTVYGTSSGVNVGIGTASPANKLTVNGDIGFTGFLGQGSIFGNTANSSYAEMQLYNPATGYTTIDNKAYGYYFATAGSTKLTILNNGNVGIGMTGPNAKLQIDDGAIKIRNIVDSSPGSDVRRNINIATFDGQGSTFTGKLIIETPVMTTGAMATFKISGWQYDESWDLTVSGYLRIGTGRGWEQIGGAILTGNPPFDIDEVRLCYNDTTNIYYIILGDASTFWDYYASIVIDADSYYQDSVPTTGWDMSIATADPSGLTSDITLTDIAEYGSSNAIIPGSVAIGSYSNNGRLGVVDGDAQMIFGSASSARPWLRLKHNVAPVDGEEVGLLDFNGFNDANQDTRYAIFTAKAEDVSDGTEDGSLTLLTMEAGTLTNTLTGRSGKVGIANANPAQALDVTGKIRVTDDIILAQQNGRIDYDNGVSTGALRFFSTSGNTERMRITSGGSVGIGNTDPSVNKLQVNGQVRVVGQFMVGDSNAANTAARPIHVKQSGAATIRLEDSDNDNLAFDLIVDEGVGFKIAETIGGDAGDDTRLTIHETSGNVSIGSTTEEGRLLVQDFGLGTTDGDSVTNLVLMGSRWDLLFKQIRTADEADWKNTTVRIQGRVDSTNMQSIDFVTDNSYNRHIDINTGSNNFNTRFTHGGNVGIGTNDPDEKLTVNGITRAVDPIYFGAINTDNGTYGPYIESSDNKGLKFDYNGNTGGEFQVWNHDQNGGGAFQAFNIDQDGNVGINMTSGSDKLTLKGAFSLYDTNAIAAVIRLNPNGDSYINGGDLGVGITLPQHKLDVGGTIRSYNYRLAGNTTNPTTTAATIYDQSGVGLTLSAHNVELRNYNGSSMVRSVFFTHNTATFTGTCTATNFILSSDETLKENVKDIDNKHIDVNWKNFELKSEPGVKRSGVIAQELETKHPEFVRTNEDGLKSVAYVDLLIAKIAELEARLEKAGI